MPTLVLQGPRLTATAAAAIAAQTHGELDACPGYWRVRTHVHIDGARLTELRMGAHFDINLLPDGFDPGNVRLLVTDMDSTLINIECIDEIADFAGVKPQVAAITESAMRGELNFEQSLTRRVGLLAGLDAGALAHVYEERLRPNPGAELMIAGLRSAGVAIALVSGGFTFFTDRLKTRLGLNYSRANTLEIVDGKLTGRVLGSIVGAEAKRDFLLELCAELGISPRQTVAMGDGANDLVMMQQAGLSIAYHAKPKVQAQAHAAINHCGLEAVLGLLDIPLPSDGIA